MLVKRVAVTLSGLLIAVLMLACGGDDDDPRVATFGGGANSASGPGISIREAMSSDLAGPLLINGFIVAKSDDVRFCSVLAESYPPQCAGESLRIEGLDLSQLDLQEAGGVTWSNQTQLLGELDGETLKVSQNVIS